MFITVKLKNILFSLLITMIILSGITGVFAENSNENYISVPILMYHSILKDNSASPEYIVTPAQLEEDLKYLKDNGYNAITITDLIEYVHNGKELPSKPIVLSFDDGHYNNYYYAFPLIKKYGMKMVISVVGKYSDTFSESDDSKPSYSYLTWEQIGELHNSGYAEILNHTYDLHSITPKRYGCKKNKGENQEDYKKMLTDDLGKLQEKLRKHTGVYPVAFTYPFGGVSEASYDIIKGMGFKASLSCKSGINKITRDKNCLYMLRRLIRPSGKSSEEYFAKILN